jgi:glycosyltransferase involved in cell wall biosynthesis
MLISNGYCPDVRAQKEAHTLALAGYHVTVIAWDRERRFPPAEDEPVPMALDEAFKEWPPRSDNPGSVHVQRVRVPARFRAGKRLAWKIPLCWLRMLQMLLRLRPDVVHAHDLDMLPLAYFYHRLRGAPVVYDAREYYPGMVRANVGPWWSRTLERLDRWLTPRTSAVLAVGERLAARHRAMGGRVWVVHNSQMPPNGAEVQQAGRAIRQRLGVPEDALLVVYVGYLTPDRLLEPILSAVAQTEHAWLAIGGDGPQRVQVQAAAAHCARIRVLGWLPLPNVMEVVAAGDVVYYGLNERDPNTFYFMPNLAFYALAAGRPLITTPVGEIADMVQEEACGVVMDAATPAAAEAALRRLADPAYRETLAERARYLGQTRYTWTYTAEQLLDAYRGLPVRH